MDTKGDKPAVQTRKFESNTQLNLLLNNYKIFKRYLQFFNSITKTSDLILL